MSIVSAMGLSDLLAQSLQIVSHIGSMTRTKRFKLSYLGEENNKELP